MPLVAIVDDDEAVRDAVKELLDSAGFSTATFASAESLLQSARLPTVACVVTDLCMPGMNGRELHQRLLASQRPIPAILVTGCAEERMRERAFEAGLAGYSRQAVPLERAAGVHSIGDAGMATLACSSSRRKHLP